MSHQTLGSVFCTWGYSWWEHPICPVFGWDTLIPWLSTPWTVLRDEEPGPVGSLGDPAGVWPSRAGGRELLCGPGQEFVGLMDLSWRRAAAQLHPDLLLLARTRRASAARAFLGGGTNAVCFFWTEMENLNVMLLICFVLFFSYNFFLKCSCTGFHAPSRSLVVFCWEEDGC